MINQKSQQADLVVQAVERFAQIIPLNIQEIFVWYFEQKGVDNPERFLAGVNQGVNQGAKGVNTGGVSGANTALEEFVGMSGNQTNSPSVEHGAVKKENLDSMKIFTDLLGSLNLSKVGQVSDSDDLSKLLKNIKKRKIEKE